jgi:CubicO group peptidase (beta-lactamase class C family)
VQVIAPEQIGFSSARLARIGKVMQGYVDRVELAGMITVIVRRGQVAHLQCFGHMDLEAGLPMQADTLFRIYSMTKPVSSVAALMLYEYGLYELDDPVSRFIPAFAGLKVCARESDQGLVLTDAEREVTMRDLLTHTSGLIYGNPDGTPLEVVVWQATRGRYYKGRDPHRARDELSKHTLQEFVSGLVEAPLAHQPGSAWRYSVATDVMGYLVQQISGQPFDDYLQDKVFGPLGMVDTGFYVPPEKLDRLAAVYGPPEGDGLQLVDAPATSRFARPVTFLSGGGGLVSTASDYVRFSRMLLNGGELEGVRLLGRKTVELMVANHLPPDQHPFDDRGYGFGLGVRVRTSVAQARTLGSVGEYGWSGAADTEFWIDPAEDLIGIYLSQCMPSRLYPVRRQFKVLTYQALVN